VIQTVVPSSTRHAVLGSKILLLGTDVEKFTLLRSAESDRKDTGLHEETSRGLFQSCSCWRPESLRGRPIDFALRDSGGLRQVRDEAPGAGVAQGGTPGAYPDKCPPGDAALPVENEHRDHRLLGGRRSRWK
jgi:hypothetical protein